MVLAVIGRRMGPRIALTNYSQPEKAERPIHARALCNCYFRRVAAPPAEGMSLLIRPVLAIVTALAMLTTGTLVPAMAQPIQTYKDTKPPSGSQAAPADPAESPQGVGDAAVADRAGSSQDEGGGAEADSTDAFPERMPSRSTWERVVSLPGMIIYLPFWAVFQVTGAVISIQSEYQVGSRLAAIFANPDGSRGVMPVYSSRSGVGLEFFLKNRPNEDARLNLTGSWGLLGRQLYQARARRIELFGGHLNMGGQLTFRNMPNERFYGIGPNTVGADETNYQIKMATAELALGQWVTPRFVVGAIFGVDHSITGAGKSDKTPSTTDVYPGLPGLDDEITVTRATLALHYNGKNRPVRPTGGWEIETRGRISQEIGDDNYAYTFAFLDVIKYAEIFRERTLFLRLGLQFSDPLNKKQIPFYELSELGSDETIRGFQRGRFRDFDAILGTVEYRYPISRAIDALLFVDAGQVQQDIFRDFGSADTQFTFGGGFRVWKSEGTLIRLELGKSEDGLKFLFQLNPTGERRAFAYF